MSEYNRGGTSVSPIEGRGGDSEDDFLYEMSERHGGGETFSVSPYGERAETNEVSASEELAGEASDYVPVAQWIEHGPSKPEIWVRLPAGTRWP